MNKDELLKEAKRRYPIGTKVLCLTDNTPEIIKSELVWLDSERIAQTGGIRTRVYKNGKWAEIISEAEDNPRFEVGKWYEVNIPEKWIFKLSDHRDLKELPCTKSCTPEDGYKNIAQSHMGNDCLKQIKPANMEEVYKFFPEEKPKKTTYELW